MAVIPKDQMSLCKTHKSSSSASISASTEAPAPRPQAARRYPVVVGGVGVLVTGDDLGSHPVGSADEGVPAAHGPVQLSAHPEIH